MFRTSGDGVGGLVKQYCTFCEVFLVSECCSAFLGTAEELETGAESVLARCFLGGAVAASALTGVNNILATKW